MNEEQNEQVKRAKAAEQVRSRCPIGAHGRLRRDAEKSAKLGLVRILSKANPQDEAYDWSALDVD
jgi:hypothetical protein